MRKLSKMEWVAVALAVVFVGYTMFGANIINILKNNSMNQNTASAGDFDQNNQNQIGSNGVIINDLKVGNGAEAKPGQILTVHYKLSLSDGTQIQNSKDFGEPFRFLLGAGQVIPGWEQGFMGMKVGGIRTIVIPPELAYGANGAGPIPPNATLVFTVELLSIDSPTVQSAQ